MIISHNSEVVYAWNINRRKYMISQKTQLQTKVQGKDHHYQCEPNASLPECFEALSIFRSYILGRIKEAEELAKPEEIKEEPKPE